MEENEAEKQPGNTDLTATSTVTTKASTINRGSKQNKYPETN